MLIAPTVKIFFAFCRSRKPGENLDFPESASAVVYRPLCRCLSHKEREQESILRPRSPQEFFSVFLRICEFAGVYRGFCRGLGCEKGGLGTGVRREWRGWSVMPRVMRDA